MRVYTVFDNFILRKRKEENYMACMGPSRPSDSRSWVRADWLFFADRWAEKGGPRGISRGGLEGHVFNRVEWVVG